MAKWPYNTARWLALRKRKMQASPLCEPCSAAGRLVPAVAVDHVVRINAGGPAFPPLAGLMSMCVSCHNTKTQGEQHGRPYVQKGCDAAGFPLDPNHEFFKGTDTTCQVVPPKARKNSMLHPSRYGTLTLPALRKRASQ
jgi:5-methylcytosine-specific restriction protein A